VHTNTTGSQFREHSNSALDAGRCITGAVRFLCVNLSADMCYPALPHVLYYMWDSQSSPGPLAALPRAPKSLPQQHNQDDNSLCCVCSAGPALSVSIKLLVPAPLLLFFASVWFLCTNMVCWFFCALCCIKGNISHVPCLFPWTMIGSRGH